MAEFRHETDRLILRDWREEDWPFFWEGTNTPGVMRWLGGVCDAAKRDAAQQRLLSYEREHGHTFWCVERRSDGAILGFCGLKRSNQTGGPLGMMEVAGGCAKTPGAGAMRKRLLPPRSILPSTGSMRKR